jgi:ferritin-like protein
MGTRLNLKEIEKEISKELIEKAKKELNKRLQNNDKEVKK